MRRRFLIAGSGLLVCVALAVLAASARGSSSPAVKWRPLGVAPSTINPATILVPKGARRLSVRIGSFTSTSIDNPPTGTSQDDASIGAGQLARKGAPARELEGQEVLTSVTPGRAILAATALLGTWPDHGLGGVAPDQQPDHPCRDSRWKGRLRPDPWRDVRDREPKRRDAHLCLHDVLAGRAQIGVSGIGSGG
jgi:hypothetical protein